MLVPYSWFQILWYFYIYGFLGWCSEVAFAAVAHGKFVNRGFVNGPICSIYGFGVMSVLLVLGPLKSSLWLLFGGSVLFTSAIEYLTGWVLEKVFHDKWWDYSKRPLNIKGYVCLEFSVLWGLACVFVVDVFQPLVAKVVDLIPKKLGWVLLGTFSALWIADNIITAMEIRKLPKKLRALQAIEDSLTAISDEIGEEIYIRTSDAKDRGMEVYTGMKEKSTELAQKRAEASIERRSELLARRSVNCCSAARRPSATATSCTSVSRRRSRRCAPARPTAAPLRVCMSTHSAARSWPRPSRRRPRRSRTKQKTAPDHPAGRRKKKNHESLSDRT